MSLILANDERYFHGIGVLAAILRSGSFAAAGRALALSPSGVSRSIARLESRLGVRLLQRTTRTVTLTDEGRQLYEQIMPLLEGLETAAATLREGRTAIRGKLRVNIHPFVSQLIEGTALKRFLQKHPELDLELILRDRMGDLVAEGFDLAIRLGEPRTSGLIARKLWHTRILTVAAPSYLKRKGHPRTPQELETGSHQFIEFRDPETARNFQWELHRGRKIVPISTNGQVTVSDVTTLHRLCLAGFGIAQVMEFGAEDYLNSGQLIDLFPDWPDERFPVYALYPSRQFLPAKTRVFLDSLAALLGTRH
jgi:DNA-binding transcriptional LysR family regulator